MYAVQCSLHYCLKIIIYRNYKPINTGIYFLYRPYGNESCTECKDLCAGHYLKPDQLFSRYRDASTVISPPPSEVLKYMFEKKDVEGAPAQALLPPSEERPVLHAKYRKALNQITLTSQTFLVVTYV